MKNNKHIKSFNEHKENLNISDVSDSFKSLRDTIEYNFNDRPEFIFSEIRINKDNSKYFTVRVDKTPYKLFVSDNGVVNIYGKGTDTHGDIRRFKDYNELSNILLIYSY